MCLTIGLSSALVAGVFQSFSEFVMKSLIATHPVGGIEAMQLINQYVYKTAFLGMFVILVPMTLGFAIYSYFNIQGVAKIWVISGALIYLVFVAIVTMRGNVPMNMHLDSMNHFAADTGTYWKTYGRVWTNWNHVRTFGAIATSICFLLAAVSIA